MQDDTQGQSSQPNGEQPSHDTSAKGAATPSPQSPSFLGFGNPIAAIAGMRASIEHAIHPNQPFQHLPAPTRPDPYHLSLDQVLTADHLAAIQAAGRLIFQTAGDTGGMEFLQSLHIVAEKMAEDCQVTDVTARPSFFYHLGDVVYLYGEGKEYFRQFYNLYDPLDLPIFAIPGNHDGAVYDETVPSLDAFVRNFCAPVATITKDAGEAHRLAMTQPNVSTFTGPWRHRL